VRLAPAAWLVGLLACGGLTETEEGVAFLEVVPPTSPTLQVGATLQLEARALNARGEPVQAVILWSAADPFLSVEEATGLVSALTAGTGGRIQARTGTGTRTLYSDFIVLTVTEPPAMVATPR
jgi:hypothetical protein